jgi:hypothetical protein
LVILSGIGTTPGFAWYDAVFGTSRKPERRGSLMLMEKYKEIRDMHIFIFF